MLRVGMRWVQEVGAARQRAKPLVPLRAPSAQPLQARPVPVWALIWAGRKVS